VNNVRVCIGPRGNHARETIDIVGDDIGKDFFLKEKEKKIKMHGKMQNR
jgi:hypothetical protein